MKREGGRGREDSEEGEKRDEGEGEERKRRRREKREKGKGERGREERRGGRGREKEEGGRRGEERGGGGGEGEKVFYFSLFIVTSSAARNCSHLYPPLSSPLSLPFPSRTPVLNTPPPLRVGGQGGSRTLKKSQNRSKTKKSKSQKPCFAKRPSLAVVTALKCSVRKRNQSSRLARWAGVGARAEHGKEKATEFITTPNDFIPIKQLHLFGRSNL